MREAYRVVAVAVGVVLIVALAGCDTNAGIPNTGNPGGGNQDDGGDPATASQVLTASEQRALQNAAQAATGITNATGTNRMGAGAPDTGPSQYSEPSEGCPSVLAELISNEDQFIFDLLIDYGDGCTPDWDPQATCSGRVSGRISLFEEQAELNFENLSCDDLSINGAVNVSYLWTGTGFQSNGNWNLQFADQDQTSATTGVGTTDYDLVEHTVTVEHFDGSLTNGDETWKVTFEDVVMARTNAGQKIPISGMITLSGSNTRTLTIRFSRLTLLSGVIELSIDGGPFIEITVRDLFDLVADEPGPTDDTPDGQNDSNGDGSNGGESNDGQSNGG